MNRRGFTLLELLVALLIGGVVLLTGGAAFDATVSASESIRRAEMSVMSTANRARWLRRAVASLEVGLPGGSPFVGTPERVQFSTYLLTSNGWWERRTLQLSFSDGRLIALTGIEAVILANHLSDAAFDYLVVPGLDSRWTQRWQSPTSAPLAIRLRLTWLDAEQTPDTLLLLVGERG